MSRKLPGNVPQMFRKDRRNVGIVQWFPRYVQEMSEKCPGNSSANSQKKSGKCLGIIPAMSSYVLLCFCYVLLCFATGWKRIKNIGQWHPKYFLSGFWVIARTPPERFWRKLVEKFPTGLPELFQASRTTKSNEKLKFLEKTVNKMFGPDFVIRNIFYSSYYCSSFS